MSSSTRKPIFGIEIEVFVKVKPDVEQDVMDYRSAGAAAQLPAYWQSWDFGLTNRQSKSLVKKQAIQRQCVKMALSALITEALGDGAGWKCVGDASLKEWQLNQAPQSDRWCESPARTAGHGTAG